MQSFYATFDVTYGCFLCNIAINGTEKESGESGVNTDTEEKRIRIVKKKKDKFKIAIQKHASALHDFPYCWCSNGT